MPEWQGVPISEFVGSGEVVVIVKKGCASFFASRGSSTRGCRDRNVCYGGLNRSSVRSTHHFVWIHLKEHPMSFVIASAPVNP